MKNLIWQLAPELQHILLSNYLWSKRLKPLKYNIALVKQPKITKATGAKSAIILKSSMDKKN